MDETNPFGPVFERVLGLAAPAPRLPAPWDFVSPPADTFGAVTNPAGAVAALRAEFTDDVLAAAGVCVIGEDGLCALAPALTDPAGAVLPLRAARGRAPFALVVRGGCLPVALLPVEAAARDYRVRRRRRGGLPLVAAPDVMDVLLLWALYLPATLAAGLDRPSPWLRAADRAYRWAARAGGWPGPDSEASREYRALLAGVDPNVEPVSARLARESAQRSGGDPDDDPGADSGGDAAAPTGAVGDDPTAAGGPEDGGTGAVGPGPVRVPALVEPDRHPPVTLLAWSPRQLSIERPAGLAPVLAFLARARESLDLELSGVTAWAPSGPELAILQARVEARDRRLVRRLLRESAGELTDLDALAGPRPAPEEPGFVETWAALEQARADAGGRPGPHLARARARHLRAYRREVVAPLVAWALAGPPVARALGVELARLAALLHEAGLRLADRADLLSPDPRDAADLARQEREYVNMLRQLGNLCAAIDRLRSHAAPGIR